MQPIMFVAANKHLCIDFGTCDAASYKKACFELEQTFGFGRKGNTVAGLDEGIWPSFRNAKTEISTGWDTWSGDYLLSNSSEGDQILRLVFAQIHAPS